MLNGPKVDRKATVRLVGNTLQSGDQSVSAQGLATASGAFAVGIILVKHCELFQIQRGELLDGQVRDRRPFCATLWFFHRRHLGR